MGQNCLKEGQAKNTYRSGCFLLCNTGRRVSNSSFRFFFFFVIAIWVRLKVYYNVLSNFQRVFSSHGLVTTVAYQLGPNSPVVYALEGSVAVAGAAIKWLRDNMRMIKDVSESENLAQNVFNTGDVYFVPAFSGLYAPYWRKDARG